MDINQKKVRCGGCSTVILFTIIDKKLVSVCMESESTPKLVDDSPKATVIGGTSHSCVHANQARTTFSSDDYDDSGYDFKATFSSYKSGEMERIHSTSPYCSEDEESGDISGEDQLRANKGNQSFFEGISKESFEDSAQSNLTIEQSSTHVTINGILMSDRLLKKAEKLSGPIHPGHYWYDSRAGFWGVMGGPYLGIIPPFIEEFDYPMPENCAGGNTGVFVNGRELHQKDLNRLSMRGLPTTRDRSYIVEISGRVLDGDSGEELDRLGKLAPTVEKLKRGFGMKVPRVAE